MNVKTEICKAFNSHSDEYDVHAKIQHEIGERLFERLNYLKMKPRYILDLGCGSGVFSRRLKKMYPGAEIIGFDIAYLMLGQAKKKQGWIQKWTLVNGDMEAMPFAQGLFDLIFANQVIHWSHEWSLLLREISRVMNPDGCLMFSTLGPDTFSELRKAWAEVDEFAHINEFRDMHDIGDCLLAEYFLDPVVDMEIITAHYQTLSELVRALKSQGVRNINMARNPGLTGKKSWELFEQHMEPFRTEKGKYALTYEVIYGQAWKGFQRQIDHGVEMVFPIEKLRKPKVAEES